VTGVRIPGVQSPSALHSTGKAYRISPDRSNSTVGFAFSIAGRFEVDRLMENTVSILMKK
jgi:hypothetical protein